MYSQRNDVVSKEVVTEPENLTAFSTTYRTDGRIPKLDWSVTHSSQLVSFWFSDRLCLKVLGGQSWKGGSAVKSTCCSSRGPEFRFQYHSSVLTNAMSPSGLCGYIHMYGMRSFVCTHEHMHTQTYIHTQIDKYKINKGIK